MWPFNRRSRVTATSKAREALGVTNALPTIFYGNIEATREEAGKIAAEAVGKALSTPDDVPRALHDVLTVDYHVKLTEKMTAQLAARREWLVKMIADEKTTHVDNVAAELDNHRAAMAREAERHEREAARLTGELEQVDKLTEGYAGLSAVLVPPIPAPAPPKRTGRDRNRKPVPTIILNKGEDEAPIIATE